MWQESNSIVVNVVECYIRVVDEPSSPKSCLITMEEMFVDGDKAWALACMDELVCLLWERDDLVIWSN